MSTWLRKLRAILGLGVVGGVCGLLMGGVFVLVLSIVDPGMLPRTPPMMIPMLSTMLGGVLGAGFGAALSLTSGRKSLDQLSAGRGLLLGAGAGALAALLFVASTGFGIPGEGVALFAAVFSTLGAGLGGGLLAVAKGAHQQELDEAGVTELLADARPPDGRG